MNITVPCPKCSRANPPGVRFCTGCGHGLGGQACAQCGSALRGGSFCNQCGASVAPAPPAAPGSIAGGQWQRAPGEFVRRVGFDELRQQFDSDLRGDGGFWQMLVKFGQQALRRLESLSITVPVGSVAVVMFDGVVTEVLQPGRRPVSGFANAFMQRLQSNEGAGDSWWDRIRNAFSHGAGAAVEAVFSTKLERTSIYFFDTRPIAVPFQLQATGSSEDHALDVRMDVSAFIAGASAAERNNAFGLFLSRMVGDAISLTTSAVHRQLRPHVERMTLDAAERLRDARGPNLAQIQEEVRRRLQREVGENIGLSFEVVAFTEATTLSLRLHLGQSKLPDLRTCVSASCGAEIKFGQRFCNRCGDEQPTVVEGQRACAKCDATVPLGQRFCTGCGDLYVEQDPREVRLLTSDGEPIELDIVFRAQCERERKETGRVIASLVAAARQILRAMTADEARSVDGIGKVERALVEGVSEALSQLNLQLLALNVLDVRGRNAEWLLNASAELRRAEAELNMGREWLRVDTDRLGLQTSTLSLVRQRLRLEQDDAFAREESDRAQELRRTLAQLGHRLGLDVAQLEDQERRQDLADRTAAMARADAERAGTLATAVDDARRAAARVIRDRAHEDVVVTLRQEAEATNLGVEIRQGQEVAALDHQVELERRAAEHDAEQVRRAAGLQSELGRQAVADAAHATQVGLDQAAAEAQRELDRLYVEDQRRQDLALGRRRSEQDILLDRQRQEQAMRAEEARLGAELAEATSAGQHGRDMEALQIAARIQAERERLEAEREQATLRIEAEREQERLRIENERLAGRTGADLLAAQAALLSNSTHGAAFAAALAAQTDGAVKLEMMQQTVERDRQMSESAKAEMRQLLEQMVAMSQAQGSQNLAREALDKDRTNVMFQQMMQMMAQNTAALAGASRSAQEQSLAAHQQAAAQAQSMSERSMDAMASVAATASRGPQQVFVDPRQRIPNPLPEPRGLAYAPVADPSVLPSVAAAPGAPADYPASGAEGACMHCATPLDPPDAKFCGGCGKPQR